MTTTRHQLIKSKIKKKFGTVSRFVKQSNELTPWTIIHALQGRFKDEKRMFILDSIERSLKSIDPGPNPENIKKEDREFIRRIILIKFGSFTSFCEKNPEFTVVFVSNVVSGKKKKSDDRFNRLLKKVSKFKNCLIEKV